MPGTGVMPGRGPEGTGRLDLTLPFLVRILSSRELMIESLFYWCAKPFPRPALTTSNAW